MHTSSPLLPPSPLGKEGVFLVPRASRRLPLAAVALAFVLLLSAVAWAQQTVLEVIPLNYRRAEDVIPVLRPLLPPQGSVSGLNNQLIVRTTPQNLEEIKRILATIDAAPRRLMVSVRQDADLERSQRGAQVSGRAQVGDNVTVTVPGRPAPPGATAQVDGVRARVYSSEAQNTDRVSQQVQVLEGGRAFIRVGQSVPVRSREYVDTPSGRRVIETTGFQDADTGFFVVPRVSGDTVTLEISTANDSLRSPVTGATNVQRVQTMVSGRLGEWIEIAGIDQQATQRDSEILARSSDARREGRRVLLRVDEVR
jgi:type II secretory pathway component GspD/PulD (secretin)